MTLFMTWSKRSHARRHLLASSDLVRGSKLKGESQPRSRLSLRLRLERCPAHAADDASLLFRLASIAGQLSRPARSEARMPHQPLHARWRGPLVNDHPVDPEPIAQL